jgi:hypothetical protein
MSTPTYATRVELVAFVGDDYEAEIPAAPESDRLLQRASEVVAYHTIGLAKKYWHTVTVDDPADQYTEALRDATCAQAEYWLEVGEEHDVVGLRGMIGAGRLQIQKLPNELGPRAHRFLVEGGLLHARAGVK